MFCKLPISAAARNNYRRSIEEIHSELMTVIIIKVKKGYDG
jgi:hypothetical protein